MKKFYIVLCLFLFAKLSFGQQYLFPNEEVIFSFETAKGKKMVLAKDKKDGYIIYRFGTDKKIELEYPKEKNKESWNKFTYSHYSRGGGVQNLAMDITSIYFQIGNFDYAVYDDYYSEGNEYTTGIIVTDLITNKETTINGKYKSIKGSFYKVIESGLIKMDEDRIR